MAQVLLQLVAVTSQQDYRKRGRIGQANITNNPGSTHVQKLGQWYCAGEFDSCNNAYNY